MKMDTSNDARCIVGAAGMVTKAHGSVLLIRTARGGHAG